MPSPYNGIPGNVAFTGSIPIASSTSSSPIQINTTSPHGHTTGDKAHVLDHQTNTNANGIWTITKVSSTGFTLNGSTFNGAGAATGNVTPLAIGATYNEPSDGDAFSVAGVNPALSALGDRTAFLGVATGAYKVVNAGQLASQDSGSSDTVLGNLTNVPNGSWQSGPTAFSGKLDSVCINDLIEIWIEGSLKNNTCTNLGLAVGWSGSIVDGTIASPSFGTKVPVSAKYYGGTNGAFAVHALIQANSGFSGGGIGLGILATDNGGTGTAGVSYAGDFVIHFTQYRLTGMPQ